MEEVEVLCVGLYLAEEHLKANGFSVVQVVLKSRGPVRVQLQSLDCTLSTSRVVRSQPCSSMFNTWKPGSDRDSVRQESISAEFTHLPEEVECQHHLQGGRPDHVDVGDEVHEALGVHRHQVDHLPHRGGAAS